MHEQSKPFFGPKPGAATFLARPDRQPASLPPVQAEPETVPADPVGVQNRNLQRSIEAEGFSSKGTIQAVTEVPVYSRIDATLYGAATPGVPLFYIVDTEHLKVCFDVLENELRKFQKGARIQVISIAYPTEVHQAEVSAISPVVEKSGMVHLEAVLQPHPHLMPGMTAIVTLQ